MLWIIFALIGTMGLGRGFNNEHDLDGWLALLISPISHSAIYFGKLISNMIVTLIAEIAVLIAFSLIYHWPVDTLGMLIVLILGTLGHFIPCCHTTLDDFHQFGCSSLPSPYLPSSLGRPHQLGWQFSSQFGQALAGVSFGFVGTGGVMLGQS